MERSFLFLRHLKLHFSAFDYLREVAVQYVAIEGSFANFIQLAEMYACTQGFVGNGFMSYFQVRGQEGPQ